jgi:Protein of unknown function (DUF3604)
MNAKNLGIPRIASWGVLSLIAFAGVGCSDIDDPTLHPHREPRFDAPAPPLRSEPRSAQRHVFWGDLHIHTSFSFDAYTMGTRAMPEDAYVYAKGGTIEHALGYPIRLSRPLDFAAVTDHAEYLGVPRQQALVAGEEEFELRRILETGNRFKITLYSLYTVLTKMRDRETRHRSFGGPEFAAISLAAWKEIVATAERHNEPGRFTTFLAYEWSSMPNEQNLHRNVIYRSSAVPDYPVSSLESENPEDLWNALEEQRRQGMEMIAIPHNGNVSNGMMYADRQFDGSPMTEAYAKQRMRNEPISEIFQVKGQSETHPILSSEDEFADFSVYDRIMSTKSRPSNPKGSYARDALRTGLEMSAQSGFNPYRFGVIGSSDSHNASASVEEDDYHGKLPLQDGTAGLRLGTSLMIPEGVLPNTFWGAAGLAAIWAKENTRDSLFEAMRRKETFATSGPRISVRFFGSWEYPPDILADPNRIERAYASGVAMGGTLELPTKGAVPRFLVLATKDPRGANLDRIQIIKAWVDASGQSFEKIFDVAASDGRRADSNTHRVGPVGNTVDVAQASYSNSIGSATLEALFSDPEFDEKAEAFYYARVIEIPTPTYKTYDAKALGIPAPEPATHQERAVTSAIWYSR